MYRLIHSVLAVKGDMKKMLTEKYRPDRIEDVIGQDHIKPRLEDYIDKEEIPNLLFSGDPGLGKTTSAIAITKEIHGSHWKDYFLELNASDERGIDVIRDRVKDFCSTRTSGMRIIFLDESDNLTKDAQSALRRVIETFSSSARFVLSCNYQNKIVPAIQSRCAVFRFQPVPDDEMKPHLMNICREESMDVTEGAIDDIMRYAGGDVRKAVGTLQHLYLGDTLSSDDVIKALPIADQDDIIELLNLCVDGDFSKAISYADDLMKKKGVMATNIINEINDIIWEIDTDDRTKVTILQIAGNADYYISEGATEKVQIGALLATITQEVNNGR